jgi:hypothetical protein
MKDNLIRWPMCACRRTGGVHPWWLGSGGGGGLTPQSLKSTVLAGKTWYFVGRKINRCFEENLKFWGVKRKKYDITKLVAIEKLTK